jgi:hypothetical protein
MTYNSKKPEWLEKSVKTIFDSCNKECDNKRRFLAPFWKRAEYYWNNIHDIYWDAVSWDWRTFEGDNQDEGFEELLDSNKTISTYRAYGESIVSAATIGKLSIRFFPEDAEDPLDIDKSRIYSDIGDYIQRMNNIIDLKRKAFVIRWNQGLVGAYTYFKRDKDEYGVRRKPKIVTEGSINVKNVCKECGYEEVEKELSDPMDMIADTVEGNQPDINSIMNEGLPDINPMPSPDMPQSPIPIPGMDIGMGMPPSPDMGMVSGMEMGMKEGECPECGSMMEKEDEIIEDSTQDGYEEEDKGMSVIELYPPLSIKIPHYATKPSQINYVILSSELHFSEVTALYPDDEEEISQGDVDSIEANERNQADYYGDSAVSENLVTLTRAWFKPCMYNIIAKDKENLKQLKKKYPNGFKATLVGKDNRLLDCEPEKLDDHWTFLKSPTDTHIYAKALGDPMVPIQDIEDDLVFLTLDTIRHAVGETFINSDIINMKTLRSMKSMPGSYTPVTVKSNRPISDNFFTTKNASLSREVAELAQYMQEKGQLVVGAFPSIYGGQFETGSKTLGVYQESRTQALQRVAIPADCIDDMLAEAIFKAVKLYEINMSGDESYAVEEGGSYKNVNLRKPIGGNVSRVEVVKSEQFPTTWEQKRAFIMELLGMNLEPIQAAVFAPENVGMISKIVGIPELKVPGENDRNKQLHEIQELLMGEPIPSQNTDPMTGMPAVDPNTGMPMMTSSVPIDNDVDNHSIHAGVITAFAVSPEGMRAKKVIPQGYENLMLHLREHKAAEAMIMQQQQPMQVNEEEKENVGVS